MDTGVSRELLIAAAAVNGLTVGRPELIRNGSHAMWATGFGPVGRVGERGTATVARREVTISAWLNECGIRTVRAIQGVAQPTIIDGYPVTWWEQLSKHRPATPAELGGVLRDLHSIPLPSHIDLPQLAPLNGLRERLSHAKMTMAEDANWLLNHANELEHRYNEVVLGLPVGLVDGDAWQGNVAVTDDGEKIVLDLEAFSIGPQYWDLLPIAVDCTDFNRISRNEYRDFVAAYGFDVTLISAYRALADVQELRWTAYVIDKSKHDAAAAMEAAHRISCIKGDVERPWHWNAF